MKYNVISLILLTLLAGCSGSKSSSGGSTITIAGWDDAYAQGFAIASPLSVSSAKLLKIKGPTLDGSEPIQEKIEFLDTIVEAETLNACNIQLPTLNGFSGNANCYGPSVNYTNHPDGMGGSGQLPTGDLGLWEPTSNGEACASAQINSLMKNVSRYVDAALLVQASMICLLKNTDEEFVTGEAVDVTSAFEDSLQVANPSATVSSATVTISEDISTFVIEGTTDGAKSFDLTIKLKKKGDDDFQGKIFGYFTTANVDAFSVSFMKLDNSIQAKVSAGSWLGSDLGDIFNESGELNQDDSFQGNMNNALLSMNSQTGEGNISYAWQAGSGDDKTRVFNAFVRTVDETLTGCGYFGYGDDFNEDLATNLNSIDGFICNWAGPGNNHSMSGTENKAQKQCFSENNGKFEEIVGKRAITYAPTVSCNDTGTLTYDWPSHSGDDAVNNLISLLTDDDYSNYSAPSIPTLDAGL